MPHLRYAIAMRALITLFGPTGSGKTALSLQLAEHIKAHTGKAVVLINADSRQVYQGMPLLAAAPSPEEYARAEHKLFEFMSPAERYSAGAYGKQARQAAEETLAEDKIPLVVGGTGFYIRALLEGVGNGPDVPTEVYASFNGKSVFQLWEDVKTTDAAWAATANESEQFNRQRLTRVLAVAAHTGKLMSEWQAEDAAQGWEGPVLKLALDPEISALKERLAKRMETSLAAGMLEEVKTLSTLPPDAPGLQALGTHVWQEALAGNVSTQGATLMAIQQHLDYTKRQRTWLRGQYAANWTGTGPEDAEAAWAVTKIFLDSLKG